MQTPQPPNVLLVEDHVPLARVLRQGLQEEGYTVEVSSDYGEAACRAGAADYNAIILDLTRLWEMGSSLLRRWRQAGLTAPVLVLAAPGGCERRGEHGGLRADGCLTVPFRLEELLARLEGLVRAGAGQDADNRN